MKEILPQAADDDEITGDIVLALRVNELSPEESWAEQHKVLLASVGGAALTLLGTAVGGAVFAHKRHKTEFA